jgi:hypothetical protein
MKAKIDEKVFLCGFVYENIFSTNAKDIKGHPHDDVGI